MALHREDQVLKIYKIHSSFEAIVASCTAPEPHNINKCGP